MASYYPPTNYFQNINFNNDFYATPNNNQGVKLEYANTHYLFSTGVATSTAFTTFFSGSIGIGTVGGEAGSLNVLNVNAINSLQINGNNISNIYISSNVIPNFLAPYDKILDRQGAILALSNLFISSNVIPNFLSPFDTIIDRQGAILALSDVYISSNVVPNFLAPYDKILDRQTAIASLSDVYISSNVIPNFLAPYDKIIDRQTAIASLSGIYISSNIISNFLAPYDKIIDRQTAITALSNTIISNSLLPYDKIIDRQNAGIVLQTQIDFNTSNISTNTANIITANLLIKNNTDATTANTNAIGGCLKTTMVQAGNIGLFYSGSVLNVVSNPDHFVDSSILATNRQLNLAPIYANLPTSKNNKINWAGLLSYNTSTDTASVDLSGYLTSIQTNNSFISSNSFFNNLIPNYVTNSSLVNQLYISSNTVANLYISSNIASNILLNYVTNSSLANQLYISSNTVENLYISSNIASNILLNYVTNTYLSNQQYISSNTVANLYISSNIASNILLNYVTINSLSTQFYISSNAVNNLYISSNTMPNFLSPYDKIIDRQSSITSLSNTYVSSNVLSTTLSQYMTSNHLYVIQEAVSSERQYPSKLYNSASGETTITFLGKTVYTQTFTLDTTGITYGNGIYTIYSSTTYGDILKNLLFDYNLNNSAGAGFQGSQYLTPQGTYNGTNFIVAGYTGDWIVLKFPISSIILTKFVFKERVTLNSRAPAEWKLYGSNDGVNFVEITQGSSTSRLTSGDYVNGFYTKSFSNSTAYQYIGFTINKVVGGVNSDMVNFSELQLFGKEPATPSINPIYISSNVIPNILQPYDKTIDRLNAITGLSNITIINTNNTSNYIETLNQLTINQFQYYLPKVITNSNIYFDTPLQILPNTQPIGYKLQNSSLLIGDGGRLLINGIYGGSNGSNFTRIGVANQSETRSGLDNTQINLYEKGFITYDAPTNPIAYGHVFNGNVRMSSLSIASQTVPNSNIRFEVGGSGSGANPFSIDVYGNITLNKVASANNLTLKAPLYFTVSQQATISGKTVYKYDLDLSKYTRYFQTFEGHKVRYFKITSIYSDGSALDGSQLQAYNYMFNNTFYMTDKNGLTMYCNDNWTNTQCEFIANDIPINYWIRNSFNYITFINRLSIANNRKWYILIQDYLS